MPRSQSLAAVRLSALRLLSIASATALTLGLIATSATAAESADPTDVNVSPTSTFPERFTVNVAGDLILTGNTLMTCPTSASACITSQRGSGSKLNNNNFSMVRVDIDDDPTTTTSSTATLGFPAEAPVQVTVRVIAPATPGYTALDQRYRYTVG